MDVFQRYDDYPVSTVTNALRYLYQYQDGHRITQTELDNRLAELFQIYHHHENRDTSEFVSAELADIALQFSPRLGQRMLREVRYRRSFVANALPGDLVNLDPQLYIMGGHVNPSRDTVYEDSQNVHNTEINESVKQVVLHLVQKYYVNPRHFPRIRVMLLEKMSVYGEELCKNMREMFENSATFGIDVTLEQMFASLWKWMILNPEHRSVIHTRLVEELMEMQGKCSTGKMARLVNVMQGFTGDEEALEIRISASDQCQAVVFHFINTQLAACADEEVVDGMTTQSDAFVAFVEQRVAEKHDEWSSEYGPEFLEALPSVVDRFLQR